MCNEQTRHIRPQASNWSADDKKPTERCKSILDWNQLSKDISEGELSSCSESDENVCANQLIDVVCSCSHFNLVLTLKYFVNLWKMRNIPMHPIKASADDPIKNHLLPKRSERRPTNVYPTARVNVHARATQVIFLEGPMRQIRYQKLLSSRSNCYHKGMKKTYQCLHLSASMMSLASRNRHKKQ